MTNPENSGNDNQAVVPIGLKIFVYVMGFMIIAMLVVLVVKVAMKPSDEVKPSAKLADTEFNVGEAELGEWHIDVPDDGRVKETHYERGVLTLVISSSKGDEVVVIDVKNRTLLARVRLATK